jgi:hypothetical protein
MTDQRQSDGGKEGIPCPFGDGGARNWKAWVNAMPIDDAQLIVIGEVNASQGYTGRLRFSHADKPEPPTQYLELNLVEEAGAPDGWREIRAQGKALGRDYAAVVILCHGEELARITEVPVVE